MILSQIENTVENLPGIGPAKSKLFAKMGIFTVADLLSRYPKDYEDRSKIVPLKDFSNAQKVHSICKVTKHSWFGFGKMRTLKISITDGSANANLIAFNRAFLEKTLPEGSIICVTGHFAVKYGELQSTSFEAEKIANEGELADFKNFPLPNSGILPVYALTEGLSQKNFRNAVASAIKLYGKAIDDELPESVLRARNLLHKSNAICSIHLPQNFSQLAEARKTLIYEELYQFEYKLALRTLAHRGTLPKFQEDSLQTESNFSQNQSAQKELSKDEFKNQLSPRQKQLYERLEFELTQDQMKVIQEMNLEIDKSETEANLLRNNPLSLEKNPFSMQRLLQGDVGSGKTLVAFFVSLRVIDYGGQCALMAPTELLAKQHAENAAKILEALGVKAAFLTGNLKSKGRNNLLSALKDGQINIVIGTHALFSTQVQYKNLRLAIIDEQHKFGVSQRESIVNKGRFSNGNFTQTPNLLMMSATPIPQTLALTVFGDLDVSTIKTMPKGRKQIVTYLTAMGHEQNVYEAVRKELEKGHQAYFVYPRIAEAEEENLEADFSEQSAAVSSQNTSSLKSAEEMYKFLSEKVYPKFKCAIIHSKIDEEEQNKILNDFYSGKTQILVATTVVEVGVDVANATCIVIEHADRFGLAELHQLRGRVGRSSLQSYCFLIYSKNISQIGIERMKALHESTDGFYIAEQDLKLRGPGEITGTTQSGYLSLGIADLERDKQALTLARYDAFMQVQNSSQNQATT